MTKSLETLNKGEGIDVNLHNTLPIFTVLFLVTSHNWPFLPPQHLLSLDGDGI